MNIFNNLKNLITKFYLLTPCLYTFLNYFFVIKAEQRWTLMGWSWLLISIIYFLIALYLTTKNWN